MRGVSSSSVNVTSVKRHLDIEVINRIVEDLKLNGIAPKILTLVYFPAARQTINKQDNGVAGQHRNA